jgi:hypothetical protein
VTECAKKCASEREVKSTSLLVGIIRLFHSPVPHQSQAPVTISGTNPQVCVCARVRACVRARLYVKRSSPLVAQPVSFTELFYREVRGGGGGGGSF